MTKARSAETQEFHANIADHLKELLERRGETVASIGRLLRKKGIPAGDPRQLRRVISGEQPFNAHLISALADALKCSPGWLLCGVGHPDHYEKPPPLVGDLFVSVGLHGLPKLIQERVWRLAWAVSMRRHGGRSDSAFREYEAVCKELVTWIRQPVDNMYFTELWSDISWINFAGRVLDGLDTLNIEPESVLQITCPSCGIETKSPEECPQCCPNPAG